MLMNVSKLRPAGTPRRQPLLQPEPAAATATETSARAVARRTLIALSTPLHSPLGLCAGQSCKVGMRVVEAGTKADRFFVVASGTWELTAPEVNRGRSVLGVYQAGSVIAERVLYRAVAKTSPGKLPFNVDCIKAGDIYVLPVDAFITITQHVSSGSVVGIDNTCAAPRHRLPPACAEAALAMAGARVRRHRPASELVHGREHSASLHTSGEGSTA